MTTEKKFPEVTELEGMYLEMGNMQKRFEEKETEIRKSLLNNIEDILLEMDCTAQLDVVGAVFFEEYWEDAEPKYAYCEVLSNYCTIDEIFFNEDTGVAEVRVDDYDGTFDIRHFGSCDLLEIYTILKERYDNNKGKE